MGGVSTSHSAVLRNGKAQSSSGFDLHSWQGLTYVLKAGKESLRDPLAYAEFRNLVLQYAQQGGDQELRKQIDAITATFKKDNNASALITPKAEAPKVVQTPPTPAPIKKEVVVEEKKIEIPPVHKASIVGVRRTPPVFRAPTETPSVQEKIVPKDIPSPSPQTPPTPTVPKVAVVPPSKPVEIPKKVIVPAEIIPEETPSAPQSATPQFKTVEEYKARIAEIKRLVNTRIGNPAALIDTHNTDGRAYMTALLGALKATGGNGTEGVEGAMTKLEDAYAKLVANMSGAKSAPAPIVEEKVIELTVLPEPPVIKKSIPQTPPPAPQVQEIKIAVPPQKPIPAANQGAVKKYSVADTLSTLLTDKESVTQKIETEPRVPIQKISVPVPPVVPKVAEASPLKMVENASFSQNKYTLKEVAKVQEKEILRKVTGIDPQHVATKQTELVSPQITEALNQLLHEWSIFSGSGFFGIGPGGSEHPLYMKLSQLSMGEVIAGRWDGADPKVTKTIKQYVDAWRHEQGIAYTINETFEHYLRRVVQRILKRQNP